MYGVTEDHSTDRYIKGYTLAEVNEKLLDEIKKCGKNVKICVIDENGKYKRILTRELCFCHTRIRYPLNQDVPVRTKWTKEVALKPYYDEVMTDIVPDGMTYTYGSLMRHPINQVEYVIQILKHDRNSRQATIQLGNYNSINTKYPPCCRIVDFKIRFGLLNMFLVFRSHDVTAYYPNMKAFIKLQEYIANEVGVNVGILGCTSESMHLYAGDFGLIGTKGE